MKAFAAEPLMHNAQKEFTKETYDQIIACQYVTDI